MVVVNELGKRLLCPGYLSFAEFIRKGTYDNGYGHVLRSKKGELVPNTDEPKILPYFAFGIE
jgi:hypothetical protein